MPLTNTQFDAIQRIYDKRMLDYQHKKEVLKNQLYKDFPKLKEIQHQLISARLQLTRLQIQKESDTLVQEATKQINTLLEEEKLLLASIETKKYTPTYYCSDCQDSGRIKNQPCHCYQQEVIRLLYTDSNLEDILAKENFSTFSFAYYDAHTTSPQDKSPLERAREAYNSLYHLATHFDDPSLNHNIFLYGSPGVGKSFLSHALAKELLDRGYSCIYYSAFTLFKLLADAHFQTRTDMKMAEEKINIYPYLLECDMLIIDDLGTEMTNDFVRGQLFLLINERNLQNKGTFISTNLDLEKLNQIYGERNFSRLSGQYQMFKLLGRDIRIAKKFQNRHSLEGI